MYSSLGLTCLFVYLRSYDHGGEREGCVGEEGGDGDRSVRRARRVDVYYLEIGWCMVDMAWHIGGKKTPKLQCEILSRYRQEPVRRIVV